MRTYSYGKRNFPELTEEQQIERIYQHLNKKYGNDGYANTYLENKEFERNFQKLKKALLDKEKFIERVKKVIREGE